MVAGSRLLAGAALGAALAVAACGDPAAGASRGDRTVRAGEEFTLAPGDAARLPDGFTVRFTGVARDGRCPRDVQCVWEGDATVHVEITAAGTPPVVRELHTSRRFATRTAVGGHRVGLLGLAPAARRGGVPAAEYRARLTVA